MKSIRNQLLLILFIVLSLAWIMITYITYLEAQHEVEEVFDSQMAQSAAVLSQFSSLSLNEFSENQKLEKEMYGHRYEKKLLFQIWEDDQLVLRSANAPQYPMSRKTGYSDETFNNELWRVFTLKVTPSKKIYVAEKHEVRTELINEITLQALYPLTLALPVLALLIWVSLGQALKPLRNLASEIGLRSSQNLEPVPDKANVPLEIKPITAALNALLEQLKWAFEREKRFTSDASHELRTPLASIKIQAQVAQRATETDQQQHAISKIIQSVDQTSHLVEQMLTLARLDPENAATASVSLCLNELCQDVLSEFHQAAEQKGITLQSDFPGNNIMLDGHESALAILIRNLLNNAILYTGPDTQVTLRLLKQEQNIELQVCDQGPGITPAERKEVFNRFHRGNNTQHQAGSGLGLSIVKRIAELHRASLSIIDNPDDNSENQGICVCVNFPVN